MPEPRSLRYRFALGAGLVLLALIAYWPSFTAAFYLDDFRTILENPALASPLQLAEIWSFSPARFVPTWTFALNRALHGEDVVGYHVVNFIVHVGAAAALFALVSALIRVTDDPDRLRWLPWIAAAIFLLHPLQTQAVTYVVQRYTSLMAFLYLASLAAFAWGRWRGSILLLIVSLLCALLALASKQTAATLPAALLLVELLFFRSLSPRGRQLLLFAVALAAAAVATLVSLPALDRVGLTRETMEVTRIDYLATQMEVLWRYIGLFLLLGEQRLEYDLPFSDGFTALTWLMAAGHAAVIAIGFAAWRRWPLVAFGVLFYYLAHLVESSLFPIIDEAFEHRTYLPNAGAAIVAGCGLAWLAERVRSGAWPVLALVILLAGTTLVRNQLWADPIAFLTRETELSPNSQRAWTSLGKELMREGRFQSALEALQQARRIAVETDGGSLRPPTLLNLIFALHYTGRNAEAVALANETLLEGFDRTERGYFHEARGRALLDLGRLRSAREELERAARLNPTANAVAYLAEAERRLGNVARARQLAERVVAEEPAHPLAREILRAAGR